MFSFCDKIYPVAVPDASVDRIKGLFIFGHATTGVVVIAVFNLLKAVSHLSVL